jgi:hypothetical protein
MPGIYTKTVKSLYNGWKGYVQGDYLEYDLGTVLGFYLIF